MASERGHIRSPASRHLIDSMKTSTYFKMLVEVSAAKKLINCKKMMGASPLRTVASRFEG
ncbi:hypothetical protein EJB05_35752, partial [Eragrostis curvula]